MKLYIYYNIHKLLKYHIFFIFFIYILIYFLFLKNIPNVAECMHTPGTFDTDAQNLKNAMMTQKLRVDQHTNHLRFTSKCWPFFSSGNWFTSSVPIKASEALEVAGTLDVYSTKVNSLLSLHENYEMYLKGRLDAIRKAALDLD